MSLVTTDDLLSLRGVAQLKSWWRVDVLGFDFTWQATIQPDRASTLTVAFDTTRQTMRNLSGFQMPPDMGAEFDETGVLVQPRLVLENGDSSPLGTFVFTDARRIRSSLGVGFEGSLADLSVVVDVQSRRTIAIQKGTLISSVIESLLVSRGILQYRVAATGVRAGSDIAYPPGTSIAKAINDLSAMQGTLPLAFDADGTAAVDPLPTLLGDVTPDVVYGDGLNIFDTGIAEWNTALGSPNVFTVTETGASAGAIIGEYRLPPDAPNSVENTFENPLVTQQQGLPDQAAADAAAKLVAFTTGQVFEYRTFDGPQDWRHRPFAVVGFRDESNWIEQSWTMSSTTGSNMSHTLKRVYV